MHIYILMTNKFKKGVNLIQICDFEARIWKKWRKQIIFIHLYLLR